MGKKGIHTGLEKHEDSIFHVLAELSL